MKAKLHRALDALPKPIRNFVTLYRNQMARDMAELYKKGPSAGKKQKILFWVPGGMTRFLQIESTIAAALKLRGIEVHFIICDGSLNACVQREISFGADLGKWKSKCTQCKSDCRQVLDSMGIPYSFVGDYVSKSVRKKLMQQARAVKWETLKQLSYGDINVGETAVSAILRYLKGSRLRKWKLWSENMPIARSFRQLQPIAQ